MKAMKYVLTVVLVLAAIIAAQMGLTGLIGFRTAELMGKTAVTALCVLLFTLFHFPCGTTGGAGPAGFFFFRLKKRKTPLTSPNSADILGKPL